LQKSSAQLLRTRAQEHGIILDMDILIQSLTAIALLISSVTGVSLPIAQVPDSIEVGLSEVSPRGEEGGFAMPASGCSASDPEWHGGAIHDCEIRPDSSVDKPIIRLGSPVVVTWDPRSHTNCVLSDNLMATTPTPDGDVADNRTMYPTGETVFSIICDGVGNGDAVSVQVLPRFQET
jgi:hypothetical protein